MPNLDVNPEHLRRLAEIEEEKRKLAAWRSGPMSREKVAAMIKAVSPHRPLAGDSVMIGGVNLHGAKLAGLDLTWLFLGGSNLHGADLAGADLTGANLVGANLHGAVLKGAVLKGADLTNANLFRTCLCGADFTRAALKKANVSECCYEGADGFELKEVRLTPAEIERAAQQQPEGCKIHVHEDRGVAIHIGAQLEGANVAGAESAHNRSRHP